MRTFSWYCWLCKATKCQITINQEETSKEVEKQRVKAVNVFQRCRDKKLTEIMKKAKNECKRNERSSI